MPLICAIHKNKIKQKFVVFCETVRTAAVKNKKVISYKIYGMFNDNTFHDLFAIKCESCGSIPIDAMYEDGSVRLSAQFKLTCAATALKKEKAIENTTVRGQEK